MIIPFTLVLLVVFARCEKVNKEDGEVKFDVSNSTLSTIEGILETEDKDNCLEKMFCLLEAGMPVDSKNPMRLYSRLLTNSKGDLDAKSFKRLSALVEGYPHLASAKKSLILGQVSKSEDDCDRTYNDCSMGSSTVFHIVKQYNPGSVGRVRRLWLSWHNTWCTVAGGACIAATSGWGAIGCGASTLACYNK